MEIPAELLQKIETAQLIRGWLVNGFAQIEYLLGDLILRCRAFAEYEEHTRTLPHSAAERINRVRNIIARDGPLSEFAPRIAEVLDYLSEQQELRNLIVHGFATALFDDDGRFGFHFQKFHREAGRIDARIVRTINLDAMQALRSEQVEIARSTVDFFRGLHAHFGWVGPLGDEFRGNEPFG